MSGFSRGVSKLTSNDASVTILDPTGPTTDLSVVAGGLSYADNFISADIAYTTSPVNVTSLSLAAGTWLVSAQVTIINGTGSQTVDIWAGTSSASTTGSLIASSEQFQASAYGSIYLSGVVVLAAPATLYLNLKSGGGSGTIQHLSVADNLSNTTGMTAVTIA